jgi:hypothetical protein
MTDEWGPWIDHDGKGCPCVGKLVDMVFAGCAQDTGIAGAQCARLGIPHNGVGSAWFWETETPEYDYIIRYRIRKPRGLVILESLLENLPEGVDA